MPDIARHALAILAKTAEAAPDAVAQVMQLQKPPAEDTVNTADTLCAIYAIRAYEAVAMAEPGMVAEQLADAAYMKIVRLASDSRLRVQMEVKCWLPTSTNPCASVSEKVNVRVGVRWRLLTTDDPSADRAPASVDAENRERSYSPRTGRRAAAGGHAHGRGEDLPGHTAEG
jgi:hypothetical protein